MQVYVCTLCRVLGDIIPIVFIPWEIWSTLRDYLGKTWCWSPSSSAKFGFDYLVTHIYMWVNWTVSVCREKLGQNIRGGVLNNPETNESSEKKWRHRGEEGGQYRFDPVTNRTMSGNVPVNLAVMLRDWQGRHTKDVIDSSVTSGYRQYIDWAIRIRDENTERLPLTNNCYVSMYVLRTVLLQSVLEWIVYYIAA